MAPSTTSRPTGRWHESPPFSPRHFYAERNALGVTLGATLLLAVLAAFDDGRLLRNVDEPILRWVVKQRTGTWDEVLLSINRLGDNVVVFILAAIMTVVAFPRCRFLALAIVAAVALRPAMEYVLKAVIDRPRPDIDPLNVFMGASHPSGHPMAFLSVWGLIPPLLAAYSASARVWWTATVFVALGGIGVASARVYRGAHWPSDVVASLLWGTLFLLAVQVVYDWGHRHRLCSGGRIE